MTPAGNTQLDFLESEEDPAVSSDAPRAMAFVIDHRQWMAFLAEEWIFPWTGRSTLRLSADQARISEGDSNRTILQVWIDLYALPPQQVFVLRSEGWAQISVRNLRPDDLEVAWPGPLPLFAVDRFSVRSRSDADRLTAMAQGFANVELPKQPIVVAPFDLQHACDWPLLSAESAAPPERWDAMRGAAAMATWAIPAIDPWLDILCASLSDKGADSRLVDRVHAPWWRLAPWHDASTDIKDSPPLWRAMLHVLSRASVAQEPQARQQLSAICEMAGALGEDPSRLDRLLESTSDLLTDRKTIEQVGSNNDVLALALQLVLLRPRPEQFVTWKDDWPAMPPGAWWTGAALSGLIGGYKALDTKFRGAAAARRLLALRTWRLGTTSSTADRNWPSTSTETLDWIALPNAIALRANGQTWAERGASNRGRWYRADTSDPEVADHVEALAKEFRPTLFRRVLHLSNVTIPIQGSGSVQVTSKPSALVIKGSVELEFTSTVTLSNQLDVKAFRDWLATSMMSHRLPRPPAVSTRSVIAAEPAAAGWDLPVAKTKDKPKKQTSRVTAAPDGLVIREEFLSPLEEASLLETIDHSPWSKVLSRNVQHYGWKYDYRSRRVDATGYLGPLPVWAEELGRRLLSLGLLREMPDQVIVNEYLGEQGISKHIDCPECFRGAVATVSLNEAWEMVFHRTNQTGDSERYGHVLQRRSVAILDGAARSEWAHEIPKRKKEAGVTRTRRVSVTFRKVDAEAPAK